MKRKNAKKPSNIALYALVALVLGVLIYSLVSFFGAPSSSAQPASQGLKPINSGTTDSGDVSIELTPLGTKDGRLEVQIAANTHSVDLSQFDLQQITVLEHGGSLFKPVSAPRLSGHHSSGVLAFDVGKKTSSFTIRITGIPKVKERVFTW